MTKERMTELRDQGWTLDWISKIAGVSVWKVFKDTGGRKGKPYRKHKVHAPQNVERDNRIARMIQGGATVEEVAKVEDLTGSRIYQILKEIE